MVIFKCARHWFEAAWRRLPAYAQAEGHLAEVEYELGERNGAIARLRRLASVADDPDYAVQLARMLAETDHLDEAGMWCKRAEKRYEQIVARHPAAFADHAADFWLSVGNEPQRALSLAKLNLKVRNTPGARALFARAITACGDMSRHAPETLMRSAPPSAFRPSGLDQFHHTFRRHGQPRELLAEFSTDALSGTLGEIWRRG